MIHTISNDLIEVRISDIGAELMSILLKQDSTEYLWQGNSEFWGGRAYNLFPICGRLTEGKYVYEGREYEMNLHGFLRKSTLEPTLLAPDEIDFGLRSDVRTRAMYPFDFEYHIRYKLKERAVTMNISVLNRSDVTMPFALGGHPGFNVPLGGEGQFEDCYIEFTPECSPRSIYMSDDCFITSRTDPFPLVDGKILPLRHSLFDRDAIVLTDISRKVSLRSFKNDRSVTVEFPDCMKYLGIWHAPKKSAPYVALEPWTSLPAYDGEIDDLLLKRDMFALPPRAEYELNWSISIT